MRSTVEDPGEGPSGTQPIPVSEEPSTVQATSTATQDPENLQARVTELTTQVKVLQRIKELEKQKEELMAQLQRSESQALTLLELEHPRTGHELSTDQPGSRNSESSSDKDVKMKHIIIFTLKFSVQRRALWLSDLQRAFRSSKKHFSRQSKRITYALDHMDEDCRQRWDQRLRENPEDEDTLLKD